MKKRIIVVGATSGIGREVAKLFAGEGWSVGAVGRRGELLESLQCECPEGSVMTAVADVTEDAAVEAVGGLADRMGGMDVFLLSSGIGFQNVGLDVETEMRTVGTNCEGFTALPSSSVDGYIDNGTTIGEWQPKGTFRKIEITDADVLDCTYYISGGKMRNATKSLTINPFRAYFTGPSYSATFGSGEAKSFRIVLSDEVSGIDSVITEKKSGRYYDLNGNVVPSPDRSGVYVRDGKKYYIKK